MVKERKTRRIEMVTYTKHRNGSVGQSTIMNHRIKQDMPDK